jgi:hypothetical protein
MLIVVFLKAHKFVAAYAAFLKRQGKLPVPGKLTVPLRTWIASFDIC